MRPAAGRVIGYQLQGFRHGAPRHNGDFQGLAPCSNPAFEYRHYFIDRRTAANCPEFFETHFFIALPQVRSSGFTGEVNAKHDRTTLP
ncbi:hypothetical protein [uncultured Lamprocystis sp.]|jgi:hypothetical protein|uniref:hypothetical protein n=1 Tax=uncultured Lamprocystis sp. TaxID=543132 RepID=UPI0025F41A94|nr:hypothetical protein [uncultured Lamprocystis sp.]